MSAFLIAQFGKNSAVLGEWKITGNELMDLTFEILKHVQYYVGGDIVYLDCEEIDKVLEFYQSDYNRFKRFGERSEREGNSETEMRDFIITSVEWNDESKTAGDLYIADEASGKSWVLIRKYLTAREAEMKKGKYGLDITEIS